MGKNRPRTASDRLRRRFGPGLITGAADDDPSGIATYSQAGAQFGLNMLWTVVLTYPLMVAVQSISARIGRVTGRGLAANLARILPRPLVWGLVGLLFIANTLNIGADLAAMGAAARLVTGANQHMLTIGFALATVILQVVVPYHRYVKFLKWLTLSLFAYVAVTFCVSIDWRAVLRSTVFPQLPGHSWIVVVVAVFGTTISPYLFFWQSSEEVEEQEVHGERSLVDAPERAAAELSRIEWDTVMGMAASNLIAFFIILTTAVTLNAHGVTDIQTAEQAALALRPLAGDFAFVLFALGIVGTGLLAAPVLAGSVAYAVGELRGWTIGLEHRLGAAPRFYSVLALAVGLGLAVDYFGLDPMKALFWSAVINGVVSVPIMVAMMILVARKQEMGAFRATRFQLLFGWAATAVMGAAVIGLCLQ